MVQRFRPGQSPVHQRRESHVPGSPRTIPDRGPRLHHPRRLSGLQRGWMPRPVSAQQFTQGLFARGSDPPPRGSQEHESQRLQSALSEQLRRNVHERIRASWHPATGGFGLGVAVADFNGDGRPDIYVSNDVAPNDVLYINNGDGTFTDKAARWLKHTSLAGMGVDVADFNNDGWPDIVQVDMMPPSLARRKRMSGYLTYSGRGELHARGFRDDFDVNSLQLSNGLTQNGDVIYSEIGRLAGIAYTDWSWSALFADFDNDGYKDILITNGYPKAVNDRSE